MFRLFGGLIPSLSSVSPLLSSFPVARLDYPPAEAHPVHPAHPKIEPSADSAVSDRSSSSGLPYISRSTVSSHNQRDSVWIIIEDTVYDVTRWVTRHPGGELSILGVAGRDCTDVFRAFHPPNIRLSGLLKSLAVGRCDAAPISQLQQEVRDIEATLIKEGKFQYDSAFYLRRFLSVALIIGLSVALLLIGRLNHPSFIGHLCFIMSSALLGLFWHQLAFLGHDFGHNSVHGSAGSDLLGSLSVTAMFGVSGQWWKRNHNVHHIHTNSVECDPDIQHLPFFAVDQRIFKRFWSTYYERWFDFDFASRFFVTHQHEIYYLAMAIARINLYVQSFALLLNTRIKVQHRFKELLALCIYWCWYLYLLSFLPSWSVRYYCFIVSHVMAGLVHVQITLSHFAMPAYSGPGYSDHDPEYFLINQFHTTLNIDCYPWLDWMHGGLQFQLEHHLFPKVPRSHLRELRDRFIRPLAAKYGLPYHEFDFFTANQIVRCKLMKCANDAKQHEKIHHPQSIKDSMTWKLIMAEG